MEVTIRPLEESDLTTADRICRLAFGTFLQLPDPITVFGGADHVRTRWRTDPSAAFGAVSNGEIVGSNFAANWGSFGSTKAVPSSISFGIEPGGADRLGIGIRWEAHRIPETSRVSSA